MNSEHHTFAIWRHGWFCLQKNKRPTGLLFMQQSLSFESLISNDHSFASNHAQSHKHFEISWGSLSCSWSGGILEQQMHILCKLNRIYSKLWNCSISIGNTISTSVVVYCKRALNLRASHSAVSLVTLYQDLMPNSAYSWWPSEQIQPGAVATKCWWWPVLLFPMAAEYSNFSQW